MFAGLTDIGLEVPFIDLSLSLLSLSVSFYVFLVSFYVFLSFGLSYFSSCKPALNQKMDLNRVIGKCVPTTFMFP